MSVITDGASLLSVAPSWKRPCWDKVKIYLLKGLQDLSPNLKICAAPGAKMETRFSCPAWPCLSLAGMTFEKWLWGRVAQRFGSTPLPTFTKMLISAKLPSMCMFLLSVYLGCTVKCLCLNLSSTTHVHEELCSCTWRMCTSQVTELIWQATTS